MAAANNVEQGKAFVKVLAAVLTRLVANNDQVSGRLWRLEGGTRGRAILGVRPIITACPLARPEMPPLRPGQHVASCFASVPARRSREPQRPQR